MNCKSLTVFLFLNFLAGLAAGLKSEKIVGGYQHDPHSPYISAVSIQVYGGHLCTGTLIASDTVLSAGHCFHNDRNKVEYNRYSVIAGTTDLKTSKGYKLKVARIYLHKEYIKFRKAITNELHIHHDIAVLKLAGEFEISPEANIDISNLPEEYEVYNRQKATVLGFGITAIRYKLFPKHENDRFVTSSTKTLKALDVKILSDHKCQDSDISYCARPDEMYGGVCRGDSGGPLMSANLEPKIVGIVSWGSALCDDNSVPQHYTKVPVYMKWIKEAMADEPKHYHKVIDLTKNIVKIRNLDPPNILESDLYNLFYYKIHLSQPMVIEKRVSYSLLNDLI